LGFLFVLIVALIAGPSLMFGAFIAKRAASQGRCLPAADGWHHARGGRFHAMERRAISLNNDSAADGQIHAFLRLPELRRGV
jgi:hypothetical protein